MNYGQHHPHDPEGVRFWKMFWSIMAVAVAAWAVIIIVLAHFILKFW